jgi:hypothetical protein
VTYLTVVYIYFSQVELLILKNFLFYESSCISAEQNNTRIAITIAVSRINVID